MRNIAESFNSINIVSIFCIPVKNELIECNYILSESADTGTSDTSFIRSIGVPEIQLSIHRPKTESTKSKTENE